MILIEFIKLRIISSVKHFYTGETFYFIDLMYFKNSEVFNINVFFSFKSFIIFKQPMNCKNIKNLIYQKTYYY